MVRAGGGGQDGADARAAGPGNRRGGRRGRRLRVHDVVRRTGTRSGPSCTRWVCRSTTTPTSSCPACAGCPATSPTRRTSPRSCDHGGVERHRQLLEGHDRRPAGPPARSRRRLRDPPDPGHDRWRPLPDDEIQDICVTLTVGSLDTLKSQLGWCFYHLATHPEDRRRLVASPELIPSAVEEFLRAYPIVSMARKVTRDVDFHGCPMKKDEMVLLTIQSATRDPRMFPDAGGGDHRPPAEPPHRLRRQRAPLPRVAPRPGRAGKSPSRSGTASSPSTGSPPTSRSWRTAARSRCSRCRSSGTSM